MSLVKYDTTTNPAGLGDKQAIAEVRNRIMSMMPGATDAPADVVWAAAQLAVAYRLDPFNGEIYIIKLGNKKVGNEWVPDYRAHVGIKGLRKKAREQAQFMTKFRDLTPDEVKAARRGEYDAADVGVECMLYRLDIAQQCARIGIPYEPFRATGYWRVKAKKKKEGGYEADNIPNTWTAHDVAEKRAEINAIKRAYDLTINVADPSMINDEDTVEVIGRRVAQIEQDRAMFVEQDMTPDTDDGDILFYPTEERRTAVVDSTPTPADPEPDAEAPEPATRPQAAARAGQATRAQLNTLHALGMAVYGGDKTTWDVKRPLIVEHATNGRTRSSRELWQAEAATLITKFEERARVAYAAAHDGEMTDLAGVELAKTLRDAQPETTEEQREPAAAA